MVENLKDLEASFWVLLRGEDMCSRRSFLIIKHFLQKHQLKIPVVDICITTVAEASLYKAALLPQIRIYHRGQEVFRHRGVANVDVLSKLYRKKYLS